VEAIVGSAGDDTITAPATVATTGAAQTTINSGDSIDGGAGTGDSLTLTITGANNNSLTGLTIKNVEKISYVGSDNLATGAAAAATATATAKTAAADLAAVIGARTAADTAAALAEALKDAADAVDALTTAAAVTTASKGRNLADTADLADTVVAFEAVYGTLGDASVAQFKAAAAAALKDATGTAITTDLLVLPRAATLAATALLVDTGADAAVTAITTATTGTLAKAYAADAAAKAAVVGAKAAVTANASIAANADATSITIDGVTTNVTSLKDTQTVTVSGADTAADTLKYASTATVANLALDGSSGVFTLSDSSSSTATKGVVTANLTGTVLTAVAATSTSNATAGTVKVVDSLNATAGTVKTLNIGLTSDAKVDSSGLTSKATSIDGSASTGGLDFTAAAIPATALNIKTGSGKDKVTFVAATDATDATKLTSSLDTGAGNDTIIVNVSGTGTSTVNAGAGDDSINMYSAVGSAVVDAGDGKDTVVLQSASFSTGSYNGIKGNISNAEVLALTGFTTTYADAIPVSSAVTIDASKVSQFTEIQFSGTSATASNVVTKVADAQAITLKGTDAKITASGYTAKSLANADGDTVTATAYAGALTVNASGTGADVTAQGSSITLNVSSKLSGLTNTASTVTLTGDVKTATINIANSLNNTKTASSDIANTLTMTVTDAVNSGADGTGVSALGNLTSVTLVGSGNVTIDNDNGAADQVSGTATKLKTVDASGLGGAYTFATSGGAKVGDPLGGLTYKSNYAVIESITLGAGKDTITASSTYAKMDTITGFTLVGKLDDTVNTTKSDVIITGSAVDFVKKTTGLSGSLDANLVTVGAMTADNVVFQNGGNTYIYRDLGTAGLTDDDQVIELIGAVNLDLLILAIES
jgi:hypothetical protein